MVADLTADLPRTVPYGAKFEKATDSTPLPLTGVGATTGLIFAGLANATLVGASTIPLAGAMAHQNFGLSPMSIARVSSKRDGSFIEGRSKYSDGKPRFAIGNMALTFVAPPVKAGMELISVPYSASSLRISIDGLSDQTISADLRLATDISAAVVERLKELAVFSAEDGIEHSPVSYRELIEFIRRESVVIRPSLSSLDTGEVRAVWKNANREQVAIHFKSNKSVNYVVFYQEDGVMLREFGQVSVPELASLLSQRKLWRLLKDER